jgi:hypothetical protein
LEHALDPEVMLRSWLKVLKPKGYIIATVPDFELYEKKHWPSKFNAGHRSTWSLDYKKSIKYDDPSCPDICIKLPEWLRPFPVDILLCRLIDTSDHSLPKDFDQTFDSTKNVEVFIEFVLRKQ